MYFLSTLEMYHDFNFSRAAKEKSAFPRLCSPRRVHVGKNSVRKPWNHRIFLSMHKFQAFPEVGLVLKFSPMIFPWFLEKGLE